MVLAQAVTAHQRLGTDARRASPLRENIWITPPALLPQRGGQARAGLDALGGVEVERRRLALTVRVLAGMLSAISLIPRTPNAERAPKPRRNLKPGRGS